MLGGYGFLAKPAENYNINFKKKPKKVVMVFRVITYSVVNFDTSLTSTLVYIYWLKWACINAMADPDWGK